MSRRFDTILDTIGRTPVVRINKLAPAHVNLFVKLEAFNPMGSVKDRLALGVIEAAEKSGALKPGQTVIEATSGNTGIGLAMVCAQKGYPLVVDDGGELQRRAAPADALPRRQGGADARRREGQRHAGEGGRARRDARLVPVPPVRERGQRRHAFAHDRGRDPRGFRGCCARLLGHRLPAPAARSRASRASCEKERPGTKVVVCEPDNSPILGSGLRQARRADGSPSESHPAFRPHLMQGWTPDFIPKLAEDAINAGLIDEIVPINGGDALRYARELAQQEGIFTGISGGATFAGALAVCATRRQGRERAVHAAGHRRALPLDAAVRGRAGRR